MGCFIMDVDVRDSRGEKLRRGFYGDNKNNLVHISGEFVGSCAIGNYVPLDSCSARIRFGMESENGVFDSRKLFLVEDVYRYIRESDSFLTKFWLEDEIERVVESDRVLDEGGYKLNNFK